MEQKPLTIDSNLIVPELRQTLAGTEERNLALYLQIGYDLHTSGFFTSYFQYAEYSGQNTSVPFTSPMFSRSEMDSKPDLATAELKKPAERLKSSARLGAIGEAQVLQGLQEAFTVENVAHRGFCGDMILSRPNHMIRIMVEVKNYTQPVPSAEVEKFRRDLQHNTALHAGLFVSLNSRITGQTESFVLTEEYESRNVPVIYLQSNNLEVIKTAAHILWEQVAAKDRLSRSSEIIAEKYKKFYKKIDKMTELLNALGRLRLHTDELRNNLTKNLAELHCETHRMEVQLKAILDSLRRSYFAEFNLERPPEEIQVADLLKELEKHVEQNNHDALFRKDKEHRRVVLALMEQRLVADQKVYAAYTDKKILYYSPEDKDTPIITLGLLKTKTQLSFHLPERLLKSSEISVPACGKYEEGWCHFNIDRTSIKNGDYERIEHYITKINSPK